jgi:2-C-methyl-D-erythritol 4-phosphate cytidylyltransferase
MSNDVWAIVLAGGSGQRFGAAKQFLMLDDRRLVDWVIDGCRSVAHEVVVVIPSGGDWEPPAGVRRADAGATRLDSVRSGLAAIADAPDGAIVVVHDPAHPLATDALFRGVVDAVREGADAAAPGVPMVEVTKRVDAHGWVLESQSKESVRIVQMPQAFRLRSLRRAHNGSPGGVEDSELVERSGGRVRIVPGDVANIHVTTPEELELAAAIVRGRSPRPR